MTCVKICGITNKDDAFKACDLGANALGFVFYEKSPRYISPEKANAIVDVLSPFVVPVALFVNAKSEMIHSVIDQNPRWQIQFHGDESDEFCQSFSRTYIKALRVAADTDIKLAVTEYPGASAILLDTYKAGIPGGTGERFNWNNVPHDLNKPIVLAGGLTPDNVQQAIQKVKPYAVDVSGGVEQSKGIKDHQKLELFFRGVVA
ncbi:phosphoribosylanthranilate isomerase [Marinomonas agarivorans]|nr:phosphoribosylanthranilate isomerase [Marinomonas agarivorans]